MQIKNVPEMGSTCLVLHNMCLILGDNFWKSEWVQEATDEVHNGLAGGRFLGASTKEKVAVANHALESLAAINEDSRENLEEMKQEVTRQYQITMDTGGKTAKELSARRNDIVRSLWMAKTKSCIAQTFPIDTDEA